MKVASKSISLNFSAAAASHVLSFCEDIAIDSAASTHDFSFSLYVTQN